MIYQGLNLPKVPSCLQGKVLDKKDPPNLTLAYHSSCITGLSPLHCKTLHSMLQFCQSRSCSTLPCLLILFPLFINASPPPHLLGELSFLTQLTPPPRSLPGSLPQLNFPELAALSSTFSLPCSSCVNTPLVCLPSSQYISVSQE